MSGDGVLHEACFGGELEQPPAPVVRPFQHLGAQAAPELQLRSGRQLAPRSHQRLPQPVGDTMSQKRFNDFRWLARTRPEQALGGDARVVQHQHIAGPKIFRQVAEAPVGQFSRIPVEDKQAGQVTLGEGSLRNALRGKRVVKFGKLQSVGLSPMLLSCCTAILQKGCTSVKRLSWKRGDTW